MTTMFFRACHTQGLSQTEGVTAAACHALVTRLSQTGKRCETNGKAHTRDKVTSFTYKNKNVKKRVITRIYTRVSTYRECIGDFWSLVTTHVRKPSRTSTGQSRKTTRRHRLQIHQPRSRWSTRPASPTPTLSSSLHRSQSPRTKTTTPTTTQVRPDQTVRTRGVRRGPSVADCGCTR